MDVLRSFACTVVHCVPLPRLTYSLIHGGSHDSCSVFTCQSLFSSFLFSFQLNLFFLSTAGKPKRPNALKTICLMLGPDFITDVIEVGILDCKVSSSC